MYNNDITEAFKPLFVFCAVITLADLNTIIGTIGGGASAIYSIIKIHEFIKNKKNEKNEKN